ncbi:MAG: hypothetical protein ABEJ75_01030 [Candidatus Nanohaloarchaea archaeon]
MVVAFPVNWAYLSYTFFGAAIYLAVLYYALKVVRNVREHGDISLRYLFLRDEGTLAVRNLMYAMLFYAVGMAVRIALIFSPVQSLETFGWAMGFLIPVITSMMVYDSARRFAETTALNSRPGA